MARIGLLLCCVWILGGCNILLDDSLQATRPSITLAPVTVAPNMTPQVLTNDGMYPDGVYDALASTMGICFEAAWDASDQVFILRSAEEHIQFYNLADNANLCRNPVRREPFDFSTGDILVGTWNRGIGCTAQHQITDYQRDDRTQTINIRAQFSTDGTCNYELVRGLWLGIMNAQNYTITVDIIAD